MKNWIAFGLGLSLSAFSLSCCTPPRTQTTAHVLAIELKPNGCPLKVDRGATGSCGWSHVGKLCVGPGDTLQWVAEKRFEIYFNPFSDPIVGVFETDRWATAALEIKTGTPPREEGEVEYKYTVLVDGCAKPLDPPIFIQR